MRIAIVAPFSWSFWSGVVEHADGQARALRELGMDARLLVGHDPPGLLTRLVHGRPARADPLPPYALAMGPTVPVPANASVARIVLAPRAVVRIRRVLAEGGFDVVHVHDPLAPVLSVVALATAECPTVATCHASASPLYPVGRLAWRPVIARIDHRIAVSEEARRSAEPHLGGPFEIVPNGVDLPRRGSPGGRRDHVLFVGRAERRKGFTVLLRAWPEIRAGTDARLRVAGPGQAVARRLLARLGVEDDGIDFLGPLDEEGLVAELAAAKALVAPAVGRESFGVVLARAFASATPVVASSIPGYREVVDPAAGLLVPPGDPHALAEAVCGLLADEPSRRALGAGARALAEERYDWRRLARRLAEIYGSLAGPPA